MGWPDLTYRSRLEPPLRNELDQLVALLIGWLSKEHGADGEHTTITLSGLQFRGPNGDILATITIGPDGIVITYPPVSQIPPFPATGTDPVTTINSPAQISDILVGHHHGIPGGSFTQIRAGIDLNTDAPPDLGGKWLIGVSRDGLGRDVLLFANYGAANQVGEGPILAFSPGGYNFSPPPAGSLLVFQIGSRFDTRLLWDEINGKRLYSHTGYFERGRTVAMGEWQTEPYNAAHYTANASTWTVDAGDVSRSRYTLVGRTMTWAVQLDGTAISIATTSIGITLPGGFTTPGGTGSTSVKPTFVVDALGAQLDYGVYVGAGSSAIVIHRAGAGIPVGVLSIYFVLTVEVS